MNSRHVQSETFSPNTGDTTYREGNSLFLLCSECKVLRPIFGEARKRYDAMTKAGKSVSFTCAWVEDSTFENSCEVPDVFAKGYDFWKKTGEEHPFVVLYGEVVDQTRLFFIVQACNDDLEECRLAVIKKTSKFRTNPVSNIWQAIARALGFDGPRSGQRLKDLYVRTFQVSKRGGDLETKLRRCFDARFDAKIAEMQRDIRNQMNTSLSASLDLVRGRGKKRGGGSGLSVQSTAVRQQRVRLYEEPPILPARTEKLLELIQTVHAASSLLGDETKAVGPIHPRTRDIFKQLEADTLFSASRDKSSRRTLPFLATTKVCCLLQTLNPKPQTPNPKPQYPRPTPLIPDL